MRVWRGLLLLVIALLPLAALFHRDDLRRWDVQRSAMAGPDEFSYLLMAQHFAAGGGLSLQENLGRETFYPPGYPILLALWAKLLFAGKVSALSAHVLNTVLLCAATPLVYFLVRRLLDALGEAERRRFSFAPAQRDLLALLAAALFATNWHILETSLLVMSEPAFMLVTFAWLALGLRVRDWQLSVSRTLEMTLLAVAAWSIRGAGLACVATTILMPLFAWIADALRPYEERTPWRRMLAPLLIALLLPLMYQVALTVASPEKSITSGEESTNSYPRQLMTGLTDRHRLSFDTPGDYPKLAANLAKLIVGHFNDYASSFVPWPRENPDFHVRDIIGKTLGILGLGGWLFHATRSRKRAQRKPVRTGKYERRASAAREFPTSSTRAHGSAFAGLYVLLYGGLFLVWPFDMARFWSPILPLMLAYGVDAMLRLGAPRFVKARAAAAVAILGLLLVLSVEENWVQLGNYARRLNYVSDALATAAHKIIALSPDPTKTIVATMGGDGHFAMAWYFSQESHGAGYKIESPIPHLPEKDGKAEHADEMLLRLLDESEKPPGKRLFFFGYFPDVDPDMRDTLASVRQQGLEAKRVYQKEIVASVWELYRDEHEVTPTVHRWTQMDTDFRER